MTDVDVLLSPETIEITDTSLVSLIDVTVDLAPGTLRPVGGHAIVSGTPADIPFPTFVVRRRGGAVFIDTSDPAVRDCVWDDMTEPANSWTTATLTIPAEDTTRVAALLNAELQPDLDAVIDVTIAGVDLPAFIIAGVALANDNSSVVFDLADRRFDPRAVGRTGYPPNLTPPFGGTGLPTGWTVNPAATDTVTVTPYGGAGVKGPADTSAMQITASGPGPGNYVTSTITITAIPFDRVIAFASWLRLIAGAWAVNNENLTFMMSVTRLDTGEVVDASVVQLAGFTSDAWFVGDNKATIPAGVTCDAELRIYAPNGTIVVEDFNSYIQEFLFWINVDAGKVIRDLVAHQNDTAGWGHSDTHIRATPTSVPDVGVPVSRNIDSNAKTPVFEVINQICTLAGKWQRLEAQPDGTDLLYADAAGLVTSVVATDDNTKLEPWQWAARNHTGVLGMFAPGLNDFTGQRLIVWYSASGGLTRGGSPDLGREHYQPGPDGNYDARVLEDLVRPFYKAKQAALAVPITLGYDPAIIAEAVAGNLRPGCFMDVAAGTWPRGVFGRLRITKRTIHRNWSVTVELNRETV